MLFRVMPRFLSVILALAVSNAVPAQPTSSGTTPPKRPLCGRLSTHHGLPVLELWGTPEQAGYAHGYLLGERIVDVFENFLLSEEVLPHAAFYEQMILPTVQRQFVWSDARRREMRGMLAGVRDRVGPAGLQSKRLGRAYRLEDLQVANTMADWYGMLACSSFSVWGALTEDGRVLTARNLDYPFEGRMEKVQVVIFRHAHGDRNGWAGVTWSGLVGVYTGMNAAGVTIAMHDSNGLPAETNTGFTPRSFILRDAIEHAQATSFIEDIAGVFRKHRVLVGNNIHVSGPRAADGPPAAVFEYDGNSAERGVTLRLPRHNQDRLTNALCSTNHMCVRRAPTDTKSGRLHHLHERLKAITAQGAKLDADTAMKLIHEVRWQVPTLHSVVFEPAERRMHVHLRAFGDQVVPFELDKWLAPARRQSPDAPPEE